MREVIRAKVQEPESRAEPCCLHKLPSQRCLWSTREGELVTSLGPRAQAQPREGGPVG